MLIVVGNICNRSDTEAWRSIIEESSESVRISSVWGLYPWRIVFVINPTLNTRTDQPPTPPTHNDDSTKMLLVVKADACILHLLLVCYYYLLLLSKCWPNIFWSALHITAQKWQNNSDEMQLKIALLKYQKSVCKMNAQCIEKKQYWYVWLHLAAE